MAKKRTTTESPRDCTLKIRGELVRFPGNRGCFVRCLMEARKEGKRGATREEIETAIWGGYREKNMSEARMQMMEVNKIVPGLILYYSDEKIWGLTNFFLVEETRAKAPAPLKGHPRLVVSQLSQNGRLHGLNESETRLIEFMMKDRMAYRTAQELALAMGTRSESSVRNTIYAIKQMYEDIFESGGWARGWRLLPRDKNRRPIRYSLNYLLTPEERAQWLVAPGKKR